MEINFKANPINRQQAHYFTQKISKAKAIDIICHSSADEDAVACAKAIQFIASFFNPQKARIISDNTREVYKFFQHNDNCLDLNKSGMPNEIPDTVICVDFSSFSRVTDKLANHIKKARNLLCIDHHKNGDISNNINEITTTLSRDEIRNLPTRDIYVDTSAKSCSAIILQLAKSLRFSFPDYINASLFCGMSDDLRKNKYLQYSAKNIFPTKTSNMESDKITDKLYESLKRVTKKSEQEAINKHINILTSLTDLEKQFQKRLTEKMQVSKNGRFAYTVIPPNDIQWKNLGGDNTKTSGIMGDFRLNTLKEHPQLDSVAVFYPDINGYRISIHSQNDNVINLFNHIKSSTIPNLQAGGHPERGGGTIYCHDVEICEKWANNIINGAIEFFK